MGLTDQIALGLRALRNVALGGNLSALPLLTRPKELVRYSSETLFHRQLEKDGGLPRKAIFESFPLESTDIRLGNLDGYTWLHSESSPFAIDLLSLCLLCHALQPRKIFEIGTFVGYTALHMALNSPPETRLFTLDLPPTNRNTALPTTATDHKLIDRELGPAAFEDSEVSGKVERLYGDSAAFDFAPWHGDIDLFFVDGAHSYAYVRSDTEAALRCVRPGGVIVWHDYGRLEQNGVTRWLHEFARDREIYAVPNGSIAYHVVK